jgi:hypothetical protein
MAVVLNNKEIFTFTLNTVKILTFMKPESKLPFPKRRSFEFIQTHINPVHNYATYFSESNFNSSFLIKVGKIIPVTGLGGP